MKKKYILLLSLSFFCLFNLSYLYGLDKPLVALMPIEASGANSFVGKALTQMLVTRLSSEGIDCFILNRDKNTTSLELADFLVSGKVEKSGKIFTTFMTLKEPKSGKVLKKWELRSQNLEALARDISLFSAKLADSIKNTGDVLNTFSSMANLVEQGEGKKIKNDFEMARMHPDVLVRENLEKDEAKEIEQERKRQEEEKIREKEQEKMAQESDDESWMPIPDPYNIEDDEDTPPKLDPIPRSSDKDNIEENKGSKKSWYSWLWPFGSSEEEKEEKRKKELLVAKAPELNKGNKEAPKIIKSNEVPIPPPPKVDFNIPEPVSMDEVYKKLEKISIEEKKEKDKSSWYSWLWPFGGDDEDIDVNINLEEKEPAKPESKMAASSEVKSVMGSFSKEINKNTPEENYQNVKEETEKLNIKGKEIPPEKPTQLDSPIWQWH